MTYYRGQQVVCVTDYGGCAAYACPVKGSVYTIAELLEDPDLTGRQLWRRGQPIPMSFLDTTMEHGKLWLRLVELPSGPHYFRAFAFRPVRPTSIEAFRKLLNPVPETV